MLPACLARISPETEAMRLTIIGIEQRRDRFTSEIQTHKEVELLGIVGDRVSAHTKRCIS